MSLPRPPRYAGGCSRHPQGVREEVCFRSPRSIAGVLLSRYKTTTEGLVTRGLRFFEKLSVKVADVVIATNESYRAIDIQRNGIEPRRVFIVRNGPDLKRVKLVEPDQHLRSKGKTILGYVGAMTLRMESTIS